MKPFAYTYDEIRVTAPSGSPAAGWLTAVFETAGVPSGGLVFFEAGRKTEAAYYSRSRAFAEKFKEIYRRERRPGMRLKITFLKKEDWFDKWQLDYRMMPLGRKFMLVPYWQKKDFKGGGKLPIFLEPKGAFGSGQHPATQMMVSFVERAGKQVKDILDLGTGTGILSVAAFRLGAREIRAYDNDPVAVAAARFNFQVNGLKNAKALKKDVTRLKAGKQYSLVCANIFTDLLIKIKPFLLKSTAPGGFLALSGVHFQNFGEFKKKFRPAGFTCLKITRKRGWAGFLFRRRQSHGRLRPA